MGRIFIGRQRELAALPVALEDALSDHGRLVMLTGEPGIGRSRTAQEPGVLAEERGAQVFWGRGYEEEGTPTVRRVSRVARTVRRSYVVAESNRSRKGMVVTPPDH